MYKQNLLLKNKDNCFEIYIVCMRGSRKFCQRGSNFDNIFFNEGREDPSTL